MPIPEDCARVQIVFDLLQSNLPVDIAVTGFHMQARITSGQTTHWADWVQAAAEGIRDRWVEHISPTVFGDAVRASVVKVFHLSTANLTLDEGVAGFEGSTAWRGNMAETLPWEVSQVVSLYGYNAGVFVPKRARKRGRMYLPPAGMTALSTQGGRVTQQYTEELVAEFGAFLNDVQGMHLDNESGPTDLHWNLGVLSTTGNMFTQLERFDIGDVFDVQTRRRNKQPEVRYGGVIDHNT